DPGYAISGAVGVQFPLTHLRAELEAELERGGLDRVTVQGRSVHAGGNLDVRAPTANLFYDIATGTRFTPYVGGGLGFAVEYGLSAGTNGVTVGHPGNTDHLIWQVEVGVGFRVTDHITIAPAYRFQQIEDSGNGLGNTDISIFKLAARYRF
ncbi:MAG TPA: outer membrane beta-barrel protein, partial [Stellaceae bacterium]|nr:outer membrane beta-barrel protein [Stellaceae bacterium]